MTTGAVIVAAGRGMRMGGVDKCALPLSGEPILHHSIRAFASTVDRIIVVVAPDRVTYWETALRADWPQIALTPGGETRGDSVFAGVSALLAETRAEVILIHDGARPLVTAALVHTCISGADMHGAVLAAVPVTDTIKRVRDGIVVETPDRAALWAAQTPQAFRADVLVSAFAWAQRSGIAAFTDEAAIVEAHGHPVHVVRGDPANIKVTNRGDIAVAEALLRARSRSDA